MLGGWASVFGPRLVGCLCSVGALLGARCSACSPVVSGKSCAEFIERGDAQAVFVKLRIVCIWCLAACSEQCPGHLDLQICAKVLIMSGGCKKCPRVREGP